MEKNNKNIILLFLRPIVLISDRNREARRKNIIPPYNTLFTINILYYTNAWYKKI